MRNIFFGQKSSEQARETYLASVADQMEYVKGFRFGVIMTQILFTDPKHLGFIIARHKFVAKMLEGLGNVLEVGCQEGLGSVIVAQGACHLVAIDFYKPYISPFG